MSDNWRSDHARASRTLLGWELRRIREAEGLTQQQVVSASDFYKDERSLRRIEAGERRPTRTALIALVACGLGVSEVAVIDRLLAIAGYVGLSIGEQRAVLRTPPWLNGRGGMA